MENNNWLELAADELNRRIISQMYTTTKTAKKLLEQTKTQMMNEVVKYARDKEISLEGTNPSL